MHPFRMPSGVLALLLLNKCIIISDSIVIYKRGYVLLSVNEIKKQECNWIK